MSDTTIINMIMIVIEDSINIMIVYNAEKYNDCN